MNTETRGFEKGGAFGFRNSDASMHNTMLITQNPNQIKTGGFGMADTMYDPNSPLTKGNVPSRKKSFKNIMKDVPIKGGKRNTSLGYQTKTTRNSSLKRTLDDALRTHGTSNN